ncbi:unnamed protein product [Meloidogyne enterolobii]|uniref:Uncharacterized protein n=1 Tax=Meloidogyne enterolobii TaxID=390850 RepID=A0ACB1A0T1_MELEN
MENNTIVALPLRESSFNSFIFEKAFSRFIALYSKENRKNFYLFFYKIIFKKVVKTWLRPRDKTRERLKKEANALTNEVNTSLVFEPMPITMERLRLLKEMGRSPSQSSFAALKAKISTASNPTQLPLVLQVENKNNKEENTVENEENGTPGEQDLLNAGKSNGKLNRTS